MAELFQTSKQNVAKHLKSIFAEGELDPASVVNHWLTTANDGKNYRVAYYNLDAILAVGYRVRSARCTRHAVPPLGHRAPARVSGQGLHAGRRALEKPASRRLGRTGPLRRVAGTHPRHPGQRAPDVPAGARDLRDGSVQKADVTVAKNYLHEPEIGELNRIVTMWLDFAEDQARRRKEIFLKDWAERLDAFLKFNERNVLDGAGRVSKKQADAHAQSEYEQFAAQRRALLEAEGAEFNVRALEDAAKALPKPGKKRS